MWRRWDKKWHKFSRLVRLVVQLRMPTCLLPHKHWTRAGNVAQVGYRLTSTGHLGCVRLHQVRPTLNWRFVTLCASHRTQ